MSDPRTSMVGAGYDAMIDTWESWVEQITDDPRHEWTAGLVSRLGEGARVLELGCGGGTRETRELAARFDLTGVDLSERQLERARERVPAATFVHGDLVDIEFAPSSFEAVVSYYVFNHVPRELLAPLLARVRTWLRPGGLLMAVFGASDLPGWTGDFLGAPTFFSGYAPEVNLQLVENAGFSVEREEVVEIVEPEGPVHFHWILALR
ncbi:MAG TPA: class I SAM-dependent methyltransferase [Gaiellaceae bacterium]|nr:class I SAM-dependent methyltransferase [Gaiellaceae bacterium]